METLLEPGFEEIDEGYKELDLICNEVRFGLTSSFFFFPNNLLLRDCLEGVVEELMIGEEEVDPPPLPRGGVDEESLV